MPTSCSVIGCRSRANAGPKKQFFRFPQKRPKVLQQWLMVLDRLDWTPKPSSKICSDHFAPEDFLMRPNVSIPRLKPEAVPSIFPDPDTTQEDEFQLDEIKTSKDNVIKMSKSPAKVDGHDIQNQENLDENTMKQDIKQAVEDDIYPKRPRRTSKINVKMKDFILLDDFRKVNKPEVPKNKLPGKGDELSIKLKSTEILQVSNDLKHNEIADTPLKPVTTTRVVDASKVDAAKELLSILEDSDNESSEQLKDKNEFFNNSGSNTGQISSSLSSSPENRSLAVGQGKNDSYKSFKKFQSTTSSKKNSDSGVNVADIASRVKAASCQIKFASGPELLDSKALKHKTKSSNSMDGKVSQHITTAKGESVRHGSFLINDEKYNLKTDEIKFPMRMRTKRPSTDLANTYFPIRCGENFFYFSYADLNPTVDLSKNNLMIETSSTNIVEVSVSSKKMKPNLKRKLKKQNEDKANVEESKTNEIEVQSEEDSSQPSECELIALTANENNDDASTEVDETSLGKLPISEENSLPNDLGDSVSSFGNSSDDVQHDDNITEFENADFHPSPVKKRKKRFKTVAEIVVRTDNAKPGELPNVSIDKINKIVDFKASKSSIRNLRRSNKPASEVTDSVDFNDNLSSITLSTDNEASEEELARLAKSIITTVKGMKLLEKVKGNDSKLTVLITTLPPIKEKEIITVQRKNIETNLVQTNELQVVVSNNKINDSSLHGSIVMTKNVGYTILPPSANNNTLNEPNNASSKNPEECENTIFNQEHPTIVCIQNKSNEKETSEMNSGDNLDSLETPNDTIIESEENENNSSEAIIHDHPYISPNVKYLLTNSNVSFNLAEVQPKEPSLKMKLSENEILFRNKVSKKLRSLKENIQKKNDAISKLKDKVRYLERNLKEVKRNRKNPLKAVKKESAALLKNDLFYGVEQLVDTSDFSNTMDYSLNNIELPLGLDENGEESDDDGERECASPITYLCEPAIEVPSKDRETNN